MSFFHRIKALSRRKFSSNHTPRLGPSKSVVTSLNNNTRHDMAVASPDVVVCAFHSIFDTLRNSPHGTSGRP
jgi:hypothetical protein